MALVHFSTLLIFIIFLVIGIIIRVANHLYRRRRGQIQQQQQPNGWKSSRPRVPINVAKFSFKHLFQRLRNESDQQIGEQTGRGSPTKPRISLATPRFPIIENKLKILAAVVTFVILIVVISESVVVVEAGHRGVVLYVGAVENRVLGEGIHFIIPFAEQVIQLEVRTLKFEANATAASNDLQEVQTTIALNYHISPSQANIIYQQLGADYADRIIAPTIQESVKASVAKFNAEELITKRATAKAVIAETIANTLGARNIVVETVFITDFKFSQAFATQVESKVVAFQKFLTEQNNLLAIQVIANQTVVQAQAAARANVAKANGESQAIQVITSQLKQSPQYLQWLAVNRWNGQMPYALGSNSGTSNGSISSFGGFPFFQLPKTPTQQQTFATTQQHTRQQNLTTQ